VLLTNSCLQCEQAKTTVDWRIRFSHHIPTLRPVRMGRAHFFHFWPNISSSFLCFSYEPFASLIVHKCSLRLASFIIFNVMHQHKIRQTATNSFSSQLARHNLSSHRPVRQSSEFLHSATQNPHKPIFYYFQKIFANWTRFYPQSSSNTSVFLSKF